MAKVLVTGGCGFVGRHLVDELVRRGDEVRVIDIGEPPAFAPDVEYRRTSILDPAGVEDALDGIERLYHIAGIAHLWTAKRSNFDDINRRGTEIVIGAGVRLGTPRIVHCSTESILLPKRRNGDHVSEDHVLPLKDLPGPYTRSKYLGEQAALQAARAGANLVVVNPTVPVGAGDANMTPPAMMMALFLKGGTPFFLDCMLNLVDVRDVARGIVLAGDKGRAGERYILGGENVALRELLKLLEQVSGRKMPKRTIPAGIALSAGIVGDLISRLTKKEPAATREGVLLALRSAPFDSSKARRELGYEPRPVEEALREELDWLIERHAPIKVYGNRELPSFRQEAGVKSPQ
jgi:dihydroflavonol-4-reductase